MRRTYRVSFTRNELSHLDDALDAIIEEFQYDGGLRLAESYMELQNRVLHAMGLSKKWNLPLAVAAIPLPRKETASPDYSCGEAHEHDATYSEREPGT